MYKKVFCFLMISFLCSIMAVGFSRLISNRDTYEFGTFEDDPKFDGEWCRGSDSDGCLDADTLAKVYIDNTTNEDVYKANSFFASYANDPMFYGEYWLKAEIWIWFRDTNAHGGLFAGPWYDYESNEYKAPKRENEPQDLDAVYASSWAVGTQPIPPDPTESSFSGNPQENEQDSVTYEVYAYAPF